MERHWSWSEKRGVFALQGGASRSIVPGSIQPCPWITALQWVACSLTSLSTGKAHSRRGPCLEMFHLPDIVLKGWVYSIVTTRDGKAASLGGVCLEQVVKYRHHTTHHSGTGHVIFSFLIPSTYPRIVPIPMGKVGSYGWCQRGHE